MRLVPGKGPRSDGKLIEVTPIIITGDGGDGSWLSLPPTVYPVDNWIIGVPTDYIIGMPFVLHFAERAAFPGTSGNYHTLSFLVRVMEWSERFKPLTHTEIRATLEASE